MIVCIGEALVDMVPEGGDGLSFLARPGGCPYNSAVAAARLGASVRFLGRIGSDFLGDLLCDRLVENGVDTSLVKRSDQPATLAFVKRLPDGNARYAFYSQGAADRSLEAADLPESLGKDVHFLLLGSISVAQEPSGSTIEAFAARVSRELLVSLDPNARPGLFGDDDSWRSRLLRLIPHAALVRFSDEDLAWMLPGMAEAEAISSILGRGPELVVLTRGARGSAAFWKGGTVEVESRKVEVVDTIGAGDTFHAAFLVALEEAGVRTRKDLRALGAADLRKALEWAGAAAALDCTKAGAEPPSYDELEAFIAAPRKPH
ncbi:MAG TPA: carbohydrate kinase [Rectinemataceae bacterium]|nr:carbohydrate kinase [Rectinemataceae bacterium]